LRYDSNIDKAIQIIREEIQRHPLYLNNTPELPESEHKELIIRVIDLADFSVSIKAYVWTLGNDNAFILNCDVLKSVKERFDKEGIEIPFPYRTLVFKKDIDEAKTQNQSQTNTAL